MQRAVPAAPERSSRWRTLRPPLPLAALLGIVIVVGLSWALTLAPFQSPDEIVHYAYSESLARSFELPSRAGFPQASNNEALADDSVGAGRGAQYPQTSPPDWSATDYRNYLSIVRGRNPPDPTNGGGPSSASGNPPLYYLIATLPYLLDSGGTTFGRLYLMRMSGVLLLIITTVSAWLLAGETLGRRRLPQLAASSVVGLLPMATFMSTAVNPDALLMPLWTTALWLGARVINRRAQTWDCFALCAVTAAAILTKATSYALVAPVFLALLIGWRRRPASERPRVLARLAVVSLVGLVPVLGWVALASSVGGLAVTQTASSPAHPFNVRQFISYVWQFYLPRLPFLTPFRTTPDLPAYEIWVRQSTGYFGWLDVYLPAWMYPMAGLLAGGVGLGVLGALARLRRRTHLALLAFFALTIVCLLGLLHIVEYRTLISGGGEFLQGRYLLPAVGLLGLSVGLIVTKIPTSARPVVCGVILTCLLAAQVISLSAVVQAYYL